MTLISTDGLVLLGPGSEWLWAMLQFVVVAVTLLGLYRQLRAQNGANVLQRMEALQGRWEAPRMIHARLMIALWRKNSKGSSPDYDVQAALNWVLGFFEDLAALEERGYITWPEIEATWALPLVEYWALGGPAVVEARSSTARPTMFTGFERLARRAEAEGRAAGENWSVSESEIAAMVERQIGRNTARLRMLRAIESSVIPTDAMFADADPTPTPEVPAARPTPL